MENRAPMSSSDVTGLLIGLPNARVFFFFTMCHSVCKSKNCTENAKCTGLHTHTHNNVSTQQRGQCKHTGNHVDTHDRHTQAHLEHPHKIWGSPVLFAAEISRLELLGKISLKVKLLISFLKKINWQQY